MERKDEVEGRGSYEQEGEVKDEEEEEGRGKYEQEG